MKERVRNQNTLESNHLTNPPFRVLLVRPYNLRSLSSTNENAMNIKM